MQNITIILGKKQLVAAFFIMVGTFSLLARNADIKGGKVTVNDPTPTAECAAAVAIATLELNNVRARVEGTGGSMWMDRANNIASYNVPKQNNADDPRFTSIFAGALWMGGLDENGQLKLAASTFRTRGNDFWPGPLSIGDAEISPETCSKFDEFFGVSRPMIDQFVAWHQARIDDENNGTNTQQENFPGYQIPEAIMQWPAHGETALGQDYYLAPFVDVTGEGDYDPELGDYPKYDLEGEIDCRTQRDVRLFGDTTIWFVFNDKGNVHTESQGPSIGMEIRGQAFAFATNDEVNNMTFYNYEMINRSTFTLTETYFGQWVDSDLGGSEDDYVGCDAERGLGYCYNGDAEDLALNGAEGYGLVPPAVGVDFFEGPFADNDYAKIGGGITTNIQEAVFVDGAPVEIDNPLTQNVQHALDSNGIPYSGLGIGYGDGVPNNERYGMRKFIYYNRGPGQFVGDGDPTSALDHYNYMRGIWRDGANMVSGFNGHPSSGGNVNADLLFPGNSDPLNWTTRGIPSNISDDWTEFNADGGAANDPFDRRFLQTAGPFTLEPGAVNDLTVGVVWARAAAGNNLSSIENLRVADDKAQALFDNCFKVTEGPDAPDLTFQELDRELILYLSNRNTSNNAGESFSLIDPFISIPDTINGVFQGSEDDKDTLRVYKFQGYQIFQLKNGLVSVSDIRDPSLSRLVAQVDIQDGITQLVNYTFDPELGGNIPEEMVNGQDLGIKHSFRITTDLFAEGEDNRLVNHKTYYYVAIAYAHNEFRKYDPNDPAFLDGQRTPYLASRKSGSGAGISSVAAIPHNPTPERDGTKVNAVFGDMPQITRVEGTGNGGNNLDLTSASESSILEKNFEDFLVYEAGRGPVSVQVIDPLNVIGGTYRIQFRDTTNLNNLSDAFWTLHLPSGDSIKSDQSIAIENEQLLLDYGISISIKQASNPGVERDLTNGALAASLEFDDPTKPWLTGFPDAEGQTDANWIRAGEGDFDLVVGENLTIDPYNDYRFGDEFLDPNQNYEGLLGGTWAPFRFVSSIQNPTGNEGIMQDALSPNYTESGGASLSLTQSSLSDVPSVDIVFTSDKNKWSRAMVLEARNNDDLSQGDATHMELRDSPSVDKDGNNDGSGTTGLGWFPGYAINVETGERLNIAFAEDSWLTGENGRDMLWNPTSNSFAGVDNEIRAGGKHYVYVFRSGSAGPLNLPAYDASVALYDIISRANVGADRQNKAFAFSTCVWAGIPMLATDQELLSTTARVKLRVERRYETYTTASTINGGLPMYEFDMTGLQVETNNNVAIDSALSIINVVPNPYYAFSEYETDQLDNRIKITNLPEVCSISIYNVSGTLMRRFEKGDPKTSLDWDLKNSVGVPVAGGVYLIHVNVPNVGERVIKWFGVIKPTDLNGF